MKKLTMAGTVLVALLAAAAELSAASSQLQVTVSATVVDSCRINTANLRPGGFAATAGSSPDATANSGQMCSNLQARNRIVPSRVSSQRAVLPGTGEERIVVTVVF